MCRRGPSCWRRLLWIVAAWCAPILSLAATQDAFPGVARAYLVQAGDTVLWAAAARDRLPPASLTKLMTALLVTDAYRPDAVVTISAHAAAASGSRLGLRPGDRMRVRDLLDATLIASANDACRALAEWHAGSEPRFVARMNGKAASLGLGDTRFANACGHDAAGHWSTAADLMRLAEAAMRRPAIAAAVRRVDIEVATVDGGRTFRAANRNALIGRYDGAIGVKSGYTAKAGKCVIALAERHGVRVWLVMLGGRDRWWDAHAMLDRAFAHLGAGQRASN